MPKFLEDDETLAASYAKPKKSKDAALGRGHETPDTVALDMTALGKKEDAPKKKKTRRGKKRKQPSDTAPLTKDPGFDIFAGPSDIPELPSLQGGAPLLSSEPSRPFSQRFTSIGPSSGRPGSEIHPAHLMSPGEKADNNIRGIHEAAMMVLPEFAPGMRVASLSDDVARAASPAMSRPAQQLEMFPSAAMSKPVQPMTPASQLADDGMLRFPDTGVMNNLDEIGGRFPGTKPAPGYWDEVTNISPTQIRPQPAPPVEAPTPKWMQPVDPSMTPVEMRVPKPRNIAPRAEQAIRDAGPGFDLIGDNAPLGPPMSEESFLSLYNNNAAQVRPRQMTQMDLPMLPPETSQFAPASLPGTGMFEHLPPPVPPMQAPPVAPARPYNFRSDAARLAALVGSTAGLGVGLAHDDDGGVSLPSGGPLGYDSNWAAEALPPPGVAPFSGPQVIPQIEGRMIAPMRQVGKSAAKKPKRSK